MRTMLLELRGDPLEEVPIEQLLRNVVEATESRTSTAVELTISGAAPLPAPLHVALYRITQEALNNVARHAHAAHAWVHLELAPGRARLSVSDDGEGFTDGPVAPTHLGLRSMRERAEEAGAALLPGRQTRRRDAGDGGVARWRGGGRGRGRRRSGRGRRLRRGAGGSRRRRALSCRRQARLRFTSSMMSQMMNSAMAT